MGKLKAKGRNGGQSRRAIHQKRAGKKNDGKAGDEGNGQNQKVVRQRKPKLDQSRKEDPSHGLADGDKDYMSTPAYLRLRCRG